MRADELDPDIAAVVDEIAALGLPEWHELSVDAARRVEDEVFSGDPDPPVADVRDLAFDGPHGEVPVRVYRPEAALDASAGDGARDESDGAGGARTLVHFHGGGWTLGTLDSIDGPCRELASRADAVVASVDYRLAPEHPFPAAVDEAAAAVEWVARNASAFGGDPDRLGVSGTSAGATLALASALHAREFGPESPGVDSVDIAGQFLLYPIAGHDFETDSYRENADGPLLTRADMRWFFDRYLRSPVDAHNPFAVPLRAGDLGDLPPATVVTAGFDPLRDDGVALAERFESEGTPVEHRHYPAMAHGFCSLADRVDDAEAALSAVAGDVRERL